METLFCTLTFSQYYIWRNDNILSDITVFPDYAVWHDMREVPDLCSRTNIRAWIDDGGGVGEIVGVGYLVAHFFVSKN